MTMAKNSKWRLVLAAGLGTSSLLLFMPELLAWLRYLPLDRLTFVRVTEFLWFKPLGLAISFVVAGVAGIAALWLINSCFPLAASAEAKPEPRQTKEPLRWRPLLAGMVLAWTTIGLLPMAPRSFPIGIAAIVPFSGPLGLTFAIATLLGTYVLFFGRSFGQWTHRLGWTIAGLGCLTLGILVGESFYFHAPTMGYVQALIFQYTSPLGLMRLLEIFFCPAAIWVGAKLISLPKSVITTGGPPSPAISLTHLTAATGLAALSLLYAPFRLVLLFWKEPAIAIALCVFLSVIAISALLHFRRALAHIGPRRFKLTDALPTWGRSFDKAPSEPADLWLINDHRRMSLGDKFLLSCLFLLPVAVYFGLFQTPVLLLIYLSHWWFF